MSPGLLVAAGACGDSETLPVSTGGSGGGAAGMGGDGEGGDEGGMGGGGMGGMETAGYSEPCTDNEQCEGGFCIPEDQTGWPQGYCAELCNDLAPCTTPGTQCVDIGAGSFCLLDCNPLGGSEECQGHQTCFDLGNGAGVCGPSCNTNADCPVLGQCNDDGFCSEPENCTDGVDNDGDALADCEDLDCAPGCQSMIDAACMAPPALMADQAGDTTGGTALFAGTCTGSAGALESSYSYTPAANGLLSLALDSATDQGMHVRTTCADAASEIACQDAAFGGNVEQLYVPVAMGTALTVFVDGYLSPLEAGPYNLTSLLLPYAPEVEDNGTFATANAFVAGTAFSASITVDDQDWIAVTVPGPMSVLTATVVDGPTDTCASGDLESELEILDADGATQLAFNDDLGFNNFCSGASVPDLAAGTYFIRVGGSAQFCMSCSFDYNLVIDVQ